MIRISGNLNMANATSLANRIEAIFDEEEPEQSWLDNRVRPFRFMCYLICCMTETPGVT